VTICSPDQYRAITGDQISSDDAVMAALDRAQRDCEDYTERQWELIERTETLEVHTGGYVYPSAYPIQSVSAPAQATIEGSQISLGGQATQSFASLLGVSTSPYAEVTYVGGYADADMPNKITEAVAELAEYKLNPPTSVGIPAGATSVTTSGQGVSGHRLAGASGIPGHVKDVFFRWRHVEARSIG